MNKKDLISCITIFYNEMQFLEESIKSVLTQSYKKWELLLIDDGSNDGSSDIAKRYAAIYPNIYYYEHLGHSNRGMSSSRNLGIQHAAGEYVAFLDADDVWLPEKLDEQIKIMRLFPDAGMVYGRTMIWHSWQNNNRSDEFVELGIQPESLISPPHLFFLLLQNKYQTPTTCNALMRMAVFEEIGYFEECFRDMFEDLVFFSKINLHFPVYVSNICWAKYRQHESSCSAKKANEKYYQLRLPFLEWLESYLKTLGYDKNRELWMAFRHEIRISRSRIFYKGFYTLKDFFTINRKRFENA